MNNTAFYFELIAGWLAIMAIGIFLTLFGKRIFKWVLSTLYDLFIGPRNGSSDIL